MYSLSRILLILSAVCLFYCATILSVLTWPASAWFIGLIAAALVARSGRAPLTTLGSARWAKEADLRSRMIGVDHGLIVGRLPPEKRPLEPLRTLFSRHMSAREVCKTFWSGRARRQGKLVRLAPAIHTAVFSPSGGGKGVSCVIPHCMTCEDSLVVLDPKGEIALKTAHIRKKRFGQKIVLLDPYRIVTQTPATYNPLDFIDEHDSQAIERCRNMGNAIVLRSPEEREPHWPESAAMWIGGIIAVVVAYGKRGESRSLQTVYEFLSHSDKRDLAVKLMCESNCWNGTLAAMGGQLRNFVEKERSSVLTTIARHMSFVGTPAVMASIQASSFDPRLLRTGKLTAYLILPPSHQRTQAGLMRLWISSLLASVVSGGLQE